MIEKQAIPVTFDKSVDIDALSGATKIKIEKRK
jgi:hypothetical protein